MCTLYLVLLNYKVLSLKTLQGDMMVQLLTVLPHSKRELDLYPVWVLWPPTVQRNALG